MAYNKKNRVYVIRRPIFISACVLCTVITLSAAYSLFLSGELIKKTNVSKEGSGSYKNNNMLIVRSKHRLSQGELLDASKAEMVEVPAELIPEGSITSISRLNNMRLKHEIAEKEFLNETDLMPKDTAYEEGDRLIEHRFPEGAVPAAVAEGSLIDIKLFMKGGEDRIVVSKAVVVSRSNDLLAFCLDGGEQEFLKEAAAEGMLFAVQYCDNSQKASEVNYIPLYDKERR